MRRIKTIVALAVLLAACGVEAQQRERLSGECRRELVNTCGLTIDRTAIRACVTKKFQSLSTPCRREIAERAGGARQATPVVGQHEIAYGEDPKQTLDYAPPKDGRTRAPLIVFIHGGGWSIGDKGQATGAKAAHFTGLGYAFASLNYRLVPNATVEQQAADVATALGQLRTDAAKLGFDADRIILAGHSAGAHLAALVGTDPRYFAAAHVPVDAIRGIVLLDGAGYDVPRQMAEPSNRVEFMYDAAFGKDPARQVDLSPIRHASKPNVDAWLILPVATRADSTAQSNDFAMALRKGGSRVAVMPIPDSSHMKINRNMGAEGDFATGQVDAFAAAAFEYPR
jgi:arylformamidase